MKKALIVLLTLLSLVLITSCDNKAKTPEVSAALVGDKTTVSWNTDGKVKETAVTVKLENAYFDFSLSASSDIVAEFFTTENGSTLKDKGLSFTIATGDGSETEKPHTLKITIKDSGTASTAVTSYISGNYSLTIPSKYLKDDGAAVPTSGVTVKDAVGFNLPLPAGITNVASTKYGNYDICYDTTQGWTASTITLTLNNCTSTLSENGEPISVEYDCSTPDYTLSGITCTATYTPKAGSTDATITLKFSGTPHYVKFDASTIKSGFVSIPLKSLKLTIDSGCTLVTAKDYIEPLFNIQGE